MKAQVLPNGDLSIHLTKLEAKNLSFPTFLGMGGFEGRAFGPNGQCDLETSERDSMVELYGHLSEFLYPEFEDD